VVLCYGTTVVYRSVADRNVVVRRLPVCIKGFKTRDAAVTSWLT